MKLRFKYGCGRWIMGKWGGKVLYPFVLFAKKKEDVPVWLFRHEMEHVYQIMRMGWWTFYIKYIWFAMRKKYKDHPIEVEATERQNEPLTATEERFLA